MTKFCIGLLPSPCRTKAMCPRKFILTWLPDLELMLQVYQHCNRAQRYLERERRVFKETQVYGRLPPPNLGKHWLCLSHGDVWQETDYKSNTHVLSVYHPVWDLRIFCLIKATRQRSPHGVIHDFWPLIKLGIVLCVTWLWLRHLTYTLAQTLSAQSGFVCNEK